MASGFSAMDVAEICFRITEFVRLPAEQRLLHFGFLSSEACTPEWRDKIKQFLEEGSEASSVLMDEIEAHSEFFSLEPQREVCRPCRSLL